MPNRKPSKRMSRVNVGTWASLGRRRPLGHLFQSFQSGVRKGLPGTTTKRPRSAPSKHPPTGRNPLAPIPHQDQKTIAVVPHQTRRRSRSAPTAPSKHRSAGRNPHVLPSHQAPLPVLKAPLRKSRSFYGKVLYRQLCKPSTTAPATTPVQLALDRTFTLPRTAQTPRRFSLPNWQLSLHTIPEEPEAGRSRSQRPRSQCVFD